MAITDIAAGFVTAAAIKAPVRVATPGTAAELQGLYALDGITLVDGDRVLVKNQTNSYENGIYIARSGMWERAKDFNSTKQVVRGTRVFVTDGFATANTEWFVTSLNPVPVGTGTISFGQAATAGAGVTPGRTIATGTGLSGGGDLSANRTIALNLASLDAIEALTPASDKIVVLDASDDGAPKLSTVAAIAGAGSVPSDREISAGTGLSGGGPLDADVELELDLSEVSAKANVAVATDQLALHDPVAEAPVRSPVSTFITDMAKRRAAGTDPGAVGANGAALGLLVIEEAVELAGAYVDTVAQVPVGAILLAVATRVTTAITGATSFSVGTAADADAFAAGLGVGLGSTSQGTVGAGGILTAASIRLTAGGSDFTGGVVRVALIYLRITPPTS